MNLLTNNTDDFKINIFFAAFFTFSMTIAVGAIWEIIEFSSDSWFGTNMQRAYISTTNGRGAALAGQNALADTMKDLILDTIGAGVMSVICAIAVITKKIKLEDLSFIKKHSKVVATNSKNIESHNELTLMTSDDEDCVTIQQLDIINNSTIIQSDDVSDIQSDSLPLEKTESFKNSETEKPETIKKKSSSKKSRNIKSK